MKRSAMPPRTVGLARGPVRLSRRMSVPTPDVPRQRHQAAQERPTLPGWGDDTRETVQRRSGGRCEVGSCTAPATDMHHRQRRREGNHGAANALHLCRDHHRRVHAHPAEARASGWIVPFAADPAREPAVVRGRLCWLTEDGRKVDAGAVA